MRKRNKEIAIDIGIAWAEDLFKDFSENPEYRGPHFTWKCFPEIAANLAEANCFMSFSYKTRNFEALKSLCREAAYKKAKELCRGIDSVS